MLVGAGLGTFPKAGLGSVSAMRGLTRAGGLKPKQFYRRNQKGAYAPVFSAGKISLPNALFSVKIAYRIILSGLAWYRPKEAALHITVIRRYEVERKNYAGTWIRRGKVP